MSTNRKTREAHIATCTWRCTSDLMTIAYSHEGDDTDNQLRDQAVHVLIEYLRETGQASVADAFRRALTGATA